MHATSIRREEMDFKLKPVDFSISIEGPSVSCWFWVEERDRKLKIQSMAMEILSQKWFHELDMEDFNLFHQSHINSMEGGFNTHEITAEIKEDKYGESLSSTRNCSNQTLNNITTKRCSSSEISQTSFEKPAKMAKINDWNSCIAPHVPPKPSPSFSSQFLSFIDSDFQRVSSNTPLKGTKRNSSTTRASNPNDHILAERKRREKLSQRFIALSAIVPGLKKMDKASVLGDAIKYINQLHDRVQLLEEQTKKKTVESVVFIKKSQLYIDDDSSSCDENFDGGSDEALLPEIEARVSEKSVLLRIHCEKHKGFVHKIMGEIEKLHLSILHSSVLPFGSSTLDITIVAEMDDGFNMTAKDLVRNIRIALIKFT